MAFEASLDRLIKRLLVYGYRTAQQTKKPVAFSDRT